MRIACPFRRLPEGPAAASARAKGTALRLCNVARQACCLLAFSTNARAFWQTLWPVAVVAPALRQPVCEQYKQGPQAHDGHLRSPVPCGMGGARTAGDALPALGVCVCVMFRQLHWPLGYAPIRPLLVASAEQAVLRGCLLRHERGVSRRLIFQTKRTCRARGRCWLGTLQRISGSVDQTGTDGCTSHCCANRAEWIWPAEPSVFEAGLMHKLLVARCSLLSLAPVVKRTYWRPLADGGGIQMKPKVSPLATTTVQAPEQRLSPL